MRKQNGITLVSMVIAIVVMLILAGTTITLSINGTLFGKTKEATEKAKEQSGEEEEIENDLKQATCSHEWTDWKIDATEKNGEARFKRHRECSKCGKKQSYMLGAYINYNPSIGENEEKIETTYISEGAKTGGTKEKDRTTDGSWGNGYGNQKFAVTTSIKLWKVIGKTEEDKLIIMSDDPVMTVENKNFCLYNQAGYLNAIRELDKISSIYGQGKYADKTLYPVGNGTKRESGARSIRLEDTGYKIETHTYEIKEDQNGEKRLLMNGGNARVHIGTAKARYFDEKTQEWKKLEYGDEPITFRDVEVSEFNEYININGKHITANTTLQNSSGSWPNCWFATKTSNTYYNCTYGSSIFAGSRRHPVQIATSDAAFSYCVQPIVILKNNIDYKYDENTNTYTIEGYK